MFAGVGVGVRAGASAGASGGEGVCGWGRLASGCLWRGTSAAGRFDERCASASRRGGSFVRRRPAVGHRDRRAERCCVAVARLRGACPQKNGVPGRMRGTAAWWLPDCEAFSRVRWSFNHHVTADNAIESGNHHPRVERLSRGDHDDVARHRPVAKCRHQGPSSSAITEWARRVIPLSEAKRGRGEAQRGRCVVVA
jgi:hypothetical protein